MGIYLIVGNNVGKLTLIPHTPFGGKIYRYKISPREIMVVGGVMAYQADDL